MGASLRKRSLVFPREHGAWGILLVGLVTGGSVALLAGGRGLPLLPFIIAALAIFWLRTPVESWMGTAPLSARTRTELRPVRRAVLFLSAISAAALAWVFHNGVGRGLWWLGAGAALAFVGQALLRHARIVSQVIGAAGLTAAAPAAYCVSTGQLNSMAWSLWLANLLFAVNQIHYVQLRIRATRAMTVRDRLAAGRGFLAGQTALAALLALAGARGWFPGYGALAFVPVLTRGVAWFGRGQEQLAIHALGRRELMYACAFGILLIPALALS